MKKTPRQCLEIYLKQSEEINTGKRLIINTGKQAYNHIMCVCVCVLLLLLKQQEVLNPGQVLYHQAIHPIS